MDWKLFIGPAVLAAIISGIVSMIGFRVNRSSARQLQTQKLAFDREMAEQKAQTDARLLTMKSQLENPSQAGAANSLRILFDNPKYPQRSRLFSSIKKTIRGFGDDELRRILVGIGATTVRMAEGQEGWHLDE